MALVIRDWKADLNPVDDKGNHVVIVGRQEGLISYLLTLLGVDVTTLIQISADRVEYRASSLAGTEQRIIPLVSMSSTYYGFHKPWKQALGFFMAIMFFFVIPIIGGMASDGTISGGGAFLGIVFSAMILGAIAVIYYLLNKKMTLGFVEVSGVVSGIIFKRSVIEGQGINQEQARRVCEIVQILIESKVDR